MLSDLDAITFALLDTKYSCINPASAYRAELNNNWVIRTEARQKHEFRRRARVELHFRVRTIKSVVNETKSWSQVPRKYSLQNLWI